METITKTESALSLLTLEEAEKQLPAIEVKEGQKSKLQTQADELVNELFSMSADDLELRRQYANEVEDLGGSIQRRLVHKSNLLREPMATLMTDLQDGGSVAQDMINLQHQMNEINPNRFNFKMSGFRRLLSKLPFVGTVLSNWMVRFETVQSMINDIIDSLKVGRERLKRDNTTLENDKIEMHSLSKLLQQYVEYGRVLDETLTKRLETDIKDSVRKEFLQKEVLFPLRQRIIDLQQQQAVNQHGMITAEAIIQNNKELIRGVDRSLNVTVVAFQTASTLAVALEHQKKVLKGVEAINETTNDLLLSTSEKLRDQGVKIQQQAASASIDIHVLKQAFDNVDAALDEVNTFRVKALPQLSDSIREMEKINVQMDEKIDEIQRSKNVAKKFDVNL